jgi:hypothetical protein
MQGKLREAWCEECGELAMVGGPVAVAAVLGVTRQTVRNWCVRGSVHARRLPNRRSEVCACSACGGPRGGTRCERCRKTFGEKGKKGKRTRLTGDEHAQKFTGGCRRTRRG